MPRFTANPPLLLIGWDGSSQLQTTLSDISLVKNVSSLATSLGGAIAAIVYDADQVSRQFAYQRACGFGAMDASNQANAMAIGLGVILGSPLSISDDGSPGFNSFRILSMMAPHDDSSNGFADQGQLEVTARVTATFAMLINHTTTSPSSSSSSSSSRKK
jgi:uncharacterized protein YggE